MKKFLKMFTIGVALSTCVLISGCGKKDDPNRVVIYSSAEEYRNEYFQKRLDEQFPDYDIVIEYMPSGNQAARIQAEGKDTEADILFDIDYGYVETLEPYLAKLDGYDQSIFMDDAKSESGKYLPEYRNGGAIIINLDVLEEKGLTEPTSYEDLLGKEWKGLISMPNPKSSGTGYIFLKSLVNAWGEDAAFAYFDKLEKNIVQFTSSGSGPVNALIQGEVAVGLGMTAQATKAINDGANLKILFFEEGSPYSLYGYGIIDGKETKKSVQEVFDFFYTTLVEEDKQLFVPEQIYKDKTFSIENYPTNIPYSDMKNNTNEEKQRLLEKWKY